MILPEDYIVHKLYSYAYKPSYNKHNKYYNAGCPICREGNSLKKKKRLYYYTTTHTLHCFNCNKTWSAINWIIEAGKISYKEIISEVSTGILKRDITTDLLNSNSGIVKNTATLPHDCINLLDTFQVNYYKQHNNKFFKAALKLIEDRKINTSINCPEKLFISLTDFTHKNRLCIPFFDQQNNIVFYQTRALDNSLPKYLNKSADKRLFGLNKIKSNIEYIFIFEGPIDAMFVENGVAVTGLNLTTTQQEDLQKYPLHKKIWVLDNQHVDKASKEKTDFLLKNKKSVFIWPDMFKCKDFNELAVLLNQNYISHKFILKHTKLFL